MAGIKGLTTFSKKRYKKVTNFIKSKPFTSFFVVLGLLLVVILVGSFINKPPVQKKPTPPVKAVRTYDIGKSPKVMFQAKIEKTGIVKIVALAPGIVQDIHVTEGDSVGQGGQLMTLSSNYQGGNAPALQAQIANAQYNNVAQTYGTQKDLIGKQREVAEKSDENSALMRDIGRQTRGDSNALISDNQALLDELNAMPSMTPEIQGTINQIQAGQDQLKAAVRNLELQSSNDKPQAQLTALQKEITLKQLEVQDQALAMNKQVAGLSVALAGVNAATMFPASPFAGVVQRVYVRPGQQVNPGTVLAEVSSPDQKITAVVNVPEAMVRNMTLGETSDLYLGDTVYSVKPVFISQEATDGLLYSVLFVLDSDVMVTDGDYVTINIPVGTSTTHKAVPFIPIDAVYQTQDKSYLLVVRGKKAVAREVKLGTLFGSFVEITTGLLPGDRVILDRTVVEGEEVSL